MVSTLYVERAKDSLFGDNFYHLLNTGYRICFQEEVFIYSLRVVYDPHSVLLSNDVINTGSLLHGDLLSSIITSLNILVIFVYMKVCEQENSFEI